MKEQRKLDIAVLAAKNIFTRGSLLSRIRRVLLLIAIPLMNHDLELFWSNDVFSWVVYDLEYSSEVGEWANDLLVGLCVLFAFWFWEMFLYADLDSDKEFKMNFEQKLFVSLSNILFVCLFIFVRGYFDLQNSGFGGVFQTLVGVACFGIAALGVVMIVDAEQNMESVPFYYELMTTTACVAITFFYMTKPILKYFVRGAFG